LVEYISDKKRKWVVEEILTIEKKKRQFLKNHYGQFFADYFHLPKTSLERDN
jgi:hypothetical protein